jgi:hypothetical protein
MGIDLKEVMSKKLDAEQSAPVFKFENIGDQIVFIFHEQRTVPTKRGEDAELVECDVLAGEKVDVQTKKKVPISTGSHVFFASTHLRRLLSEHKLMRGDTARIQFSEIGPKSVKLFGIEILERVSGNGSEPEENWPQ